MTSALVRWAHQVRPEDLPEAVVHAARRAVVDSLGVTLGGSGNEAVAILREHLQDVGGPPAAVVVGHRSRTDVVSATLLNGVMAHVLDFDDTLLPTRVHASAPLLPALLAVGDQRGVAWRGVLTCFAVGLELQARLALAMYPDFADRGWHGTSVVGPVAVAAAVGRLLGLDEARMSHAVGLGATQSAGITAVFGSMAKSLNLGRAGASGVQCALLAERGFTSNPAALDGPAKWFRRYSDVFDPEALVGDLGRRWAVEIDGFKPYACGLVAHAVIDGVLDLRSRTGRAAHDVDSLHLRVPPETLVLMGNPAPTTELEAKFSVTYCAAAAYVDGSAGPDSFEDDRVNGPAYQALLARVSVEADAGLRQDEAVVTLTCDDRVEVTHVQHALGTQANPMTDGQLEAKFLRLASPVLGSTDSDELAARLWAADSEPVSGITAALQPRQEHSE